MAMTFIAIASLKRETMRLSLALICQKAYGICGIYHIALLYAKYTKTVRAHARASPQMLARERSN